MAQPRARSSRSVSVPAPAARRTNPTVWVVGGLVALAAIGGIVALSGTAAATPSPSPNPTPNPGAGAGKPCPASNLPSQLYTYRLADTGTTKAVTSVDVVHTALLIQEAQVAGYDWNVVSSDPTVLAKFQTTTGPDPSSAHGTDRLDYWRPMGSGTATLTGQLVPKNASGPAIGSFTLTVQVSCAGGAGAVQNPLPSPPPVIPVGAQHPLTAGTTYTINVHASKAVTPPTLAALQASLNSLLGSGAVTVASVGSPPAAWAVQSSGNPILDTSTVRIKLVANKALNVSDGQLLLATQIAPPYSVTVQQT